MPVSPSFSGCFDRVCSVLSRLQLPRLRSGGWGALCAPMMAIVTTRTSAWQRTLSATAFAHADPWYVLVLGNLLRRCATPDHLLVLRRAPQKVHMCCMPLCYTPLLF